MNKFDYKNAFTIAEISVALLVIAFLGMILIPSLFNSSEKKLAETGLAKAYTQLQDICHSIALYETNSIGPNNGRNRIIDRNGDFLFTILHDVVPETEKIFTFNANHTFAEYTRGYVPNLANGNMRNDLTQAAAGNQGDVVFLRNNVGLFYDSFNAANHQGTIAVDVNGKKPPNTTGEDIFYFTFTVDPNTRAINVAPFHNPGAANNACPAVDSRECAYRVINLDNGKILYW